MTAIKQKKRKLASKCHQKNQTGERPGKYILTYEDGAPIFTCDTCAHQDTTWKKFYTEYLQLFRTKENWDNKKHQVSCIIGYFCHEYKNFYNVNYTFVPKNPNPYGAKECRDAWALLSAFSGDAHKTRRYIKWVFKHILNKNTNVISFGYFNTPAIIRRFNIYWSKKNTLSRESKLPNDFIEWCNANVPEVFGKYALGTMNDLGCLLNYCSTYKNEILDDSVEKKILIRAEQMNLIKNDKLNIGEHNAQNVG